MADPTTTTQTAATSAPAATTTADASAAAASSASTPGAGATEQKAATTSAEPSLLGGAKDAETATETKAEGTEGEKKEGETTEAAPITYTDFTLPEGFTADAESMDAAKQLFAGAKLDQETAQKFVDLSTQMQQKAMEQPYKLWHETQVQWQNQIKADPDFGGDKLSANLAIASKAIDRFGGQGLRDALNISGAGNNPEVIKAFIRVGKAISEDSLVLGRGGGGQVETSRGQALYGGRPDPLNPKTE